MNNHFLWDTQLTNWEVEHCTQHTQLSYYTHCSSFMTQPIC